MHNIKGLPWKSLFLTMFANWELENRPSRYYQSSACPMVPDHANKSKKNIQTCIILEREEFRIRERYKIHVTKVNFTIF